MIIDIHGHYTTEPAAFHAFRDKQLAGLADASRRPSSSDLGLEDDLIIQSVQPQLTFQRERGTDLTLFSPRAAGMAHHVGPEAVSRQWTSMCNDLIHRVCSLLPDSFVGVGQLPQSPGVSPRNCVPELKRIVRELGFVGVNLNPDPTGGMWTDPPLIDEYWYPLYEALCELDVPAMIHVSSSCNPNFHGTGAHYINGDTTAFMQLIQGDLFRRFPTLRFVIPHGGGAVPYHWGRYRGLAQNLGRPKLAEYLLNNVFFDTCVYHLAGIELLSKVIPAENILFGSEMVGAVRGVDPETGYHFDDTKRYIDGLVGLSDEDRYKYLEGNARRVYPALNRLLTKRGHPPRQGGAQK
jgi:4-oxalmesaconate hydratase